MPTALGTIASHRTAAAGPALPVTAGLLAWFDPTVDSAFTYSTGNDPGDPGQTYVSKWNDLSGNANHATGSVNAGYHPKRNVTINGLKAVDFSTGYIGVLKGLKIATIPRELSKPVSYFFITRLPASIGSGKQLNASGVQVRFGSTTFIEILVYAQGQFGNAPITPSTTYLVGVTYSATGQYSIRLNGVEKSSGTNNMTVVAGGASALGAADDTDNASFGGILGEYAMYNRVLTAQEITNVESYLTNRWFPKPDTISGLQAWYDASDSSTFTYSSGTVVSQWNDKSGGNRHMVQATVTKQPSRSGTQNGKPTVVFNPATNFMQCATLNPTDPFTIVIAVNQTANGLYVQQMGGWGTFQGWDYVTQRASDNSSSGSNIGALGIHATLAEWATPAAGAIYRDNGIKDTYGSSLGPSNWTAGACLNANDEGFGGKAAMEIYEVCFYNRILNATERGNIFAYLKSKWGTP